MRRLLFILLFVTLTLSACEGASSPECNDSQELMDGKCEDIDPSDDDPLEHPFENYSGYATTVEIEQQGTPEEIQYPGLSFGAIYEDVNYSAVSQVLCVTVYIMDSNYQGATYYLVGRFVGATLEEERYIFTSTKSSATYQACFNGVSLEHPYEILIAKDDTDAPVSHSTLFSVNTLTLHDPYMEERSIIYQVAIDPKEPSFLAKDEIPSIELSPILQDAGRAITSMQFRLYEKNSDVVLNTLDITIDSSMYEGDNLVLPTILFENLAPGTEYLIKGTMSGHDGIDSFSSIQAVRYHRTTNTYEHVEIENSSHDLYAVITGFDVIGDEIEVFYVIHNDTNTSIDFVAEIGWMDENFNVQTDTILLTETMGSFTYLTDNIVGGGSILIKESGSRDYFSLLRNMSGRNYYNFYYPTSYDTKLQLEVMDPYHDVHSAILTIYDGDMNVLETIDISEYGEGNHLLEITTNKNNYQSLIGIITYEVDTLFGTASYEDQMNIPK